MLVARQDLGGQPLLQVSGDVDHAAAPGLRGAVTEAFSGGASHILFDLSSCPYLDSGGISVLLEALRRVRPGGWLGVIAASPHVLRILGIVGVTMDPFFRSFSTTAEAKTALSDKCSRAKAGERGHAVSGMGAAPAGDSKEHA